MANSKKFLSPGEIPQQVPLFPLRGALLLPRGQLPLNIFEPRYRAMIDYALANDRVIAMVQPEFSSSDEKDPDQPESPENDAQLSSVGCLGRISLFEDADQDQYFVILDGITRFTLGRETTDEHDLPFRTAEIDTSDYIADFIPNDGEKSVDREKLLHTLRAYFDVHQFDVDWEAVNESQTEELVNNFSMASPYGAREKQALLESASLSNRAETLIALAEVEMKRMQSGSHVLQ